MLEKSSQFLSSEQPYEPKSFDVALNIAGIEKIPSETLWLRSCGDVSFLTSIRVSTVILRLGKVEFFM